MNNTLETQYSLKSAFGILNGALLLQSLLWGAVGFWSREHFLTSLVCFYLVVFAPTFYVSDSLACTATACRFISSVTVFLYNVCTFVIGLSLSGWMPISCSSKLVCLTVFHTGLGVIFLFVHVVDPHAPQEADEAMDFLRQAHNFLDPMIACLSVLWFFLISSARCGQLCRGLTPSAYNTTTCWLINGAIIAAVGTEKYFVNSISTYTDILWAKVAHLCRVGVLQLSVRFVAKHSSGVVTFRSSASP
jgi:hypothetical protein